jgi:hypothetical protein
MYRKSKEMARAMSKEKRKKESDIQLNFAALPGVGFR